MATGHTRARTFTTLLSAAVLSGCAARTSVQWSPQLAAADHSSIGLVFVMEPVVATTAAPGNVGRDVPAITRELATRVLTAVRERFPHAEMAAGAPADSLRFGAAYRAASGEAIVTPQEYLAASLACERGATHLLVPTITEWREMRTDDPIGALTVPHNSISVTLRLMRLQPPALARRVVFRNQARLTVNQSADRLLSDRFGDVVLQLVGEAPHTDKRP